MKATGIVRNVDGVGRFVIPSEMRKVFGIKDTGGALEMFVEDDRIILKKYEPSCIFCKCEENIINFKGKNICSKCAEELGSCK